jgi:hypothetical protein
MGLLDEYYPEDPDKRQAASMGLLSLGASMLANANKGFGGALGSGVVNGLQGYQTGMKNSMDTRQKEMELNLRKQLFGEIAGAQPADTAQPQAVQTALTQGAANGSLGPTTQNAALLPPTQAPRQGGPSMKTMQQMAILGMKGAEPLFNMFKYQNDGVERKPGSFYVNPTTGQREYVNDPTKGINFDPATNSVSPITGFNENVASLEGGKTKASEQAKAEFDLVDPGKFVLQGGQPFVGTRMDFIKQTRAGQSPASPSKAGPEGLDTSRLTPQQVAYLKKQDPEAFQNGVNRFAATSGTAPVLQSEVEKTAQVGAVTSRIGTQNKLNDNWISTSYNPVLEQGKAASSTLASLDALKNIDMKTGWGADAKANSAAFLTSLGIAPKSAEMFAANAQKFQSVAMDRLLTNLQAQKGPQTEGDSTRAQAVFAQLNNTPQANAFISDFARAKANSDARKAQFYQEALPLAQSGGDLNEIDRRWMKIQGSIWSDPILQKYKAK